MSRKPKRGSTEAFRILMRPKPLRATVQPTYKLSASRSGSERAEPAANLSPRTGEAAVTISLGFQPWSGEQCRRRLAALQDRPAKENLMQLRLALDQARVQSNSAVVTRAKTAIRTAEAKIRAAMIAFTGVQREHQVGQRTTFRRLDLRWTGLGMPDYEPQT
jgi:hypothetical protein